MLFDKYESESQFREEFVKPLLNRLGFFAVVETHGQREFGKDFVFSEVTPLGIVRHYAAQVKHEKSIQQTQHAKLSELAGQIRQAFVVPFKLADSPRERHVSAVYIFNSGSLTEGAQEYLLRSLEKESFGDNVHFLDGARLDSLNRFTTYARNQDVRTRLLGLQTQLCMNVMLWNSIRADLPTFNEARGPILAGVEAFLTSPICLDQVPIGEVSQIWQKARIVDAICHRYLMGVTPRQEDVKRSDVASVDKLTSDLSGHAAQVSAGIDAALALLRPL